MSVIDAEISLLRAQDDITELHRGITALNQKNEDLNRKIKLCFDEAIEYKEENRLLRNERDDLKNIINLADDGISELNHHWKAKYSTWKNVEVELRKQIDMNKIEYQKQIDNMSSSHIVKIDHLTCSNNKLFQELTISRSENTTLQENVKFLTAKLEMINEKLKIESEKTIKNILVSKDNEILQGKVDALESQINDLCEESRIKKTESPLQRSTQDNSERDLHNFTMRKTKPNDDISSEELFCEITRLRSYLVEKDKIIAGQQIQLNESVCANEAQLLKIKYYQTTLATAKTSYNDGNINLKNAREKLVKLNESLVDTKEKLKSISKDNVDLKNTLAIKASLLLEKDQELLFFQRCLGDQELIYEEKIKELDNFKHTISLMESEKISLEKMIDDVRGEMTCKEHDYRYGLMTSNVKNEKVLKHRDAVESELSNVSQQLKLSLKENADLQSKLSSESKEYHNHYISLESKYKNVISELETTRTDNDMLKNQVKILEDTINDSINGRNELIYTMTETINCLKTTRNDETLQYTEKIKYLSREVDLLKLKLEIVPNIPIFHDKSQNTSDVQDQLKDTQEAQEISLLKSNLSDLAEELDMKNKLLARAQKELNTKIVEVGKNQWEIEKLRVKVSSHQNTQIMTVLKPSESHSSHNESQVTIQKLESDLVERESKIQGLNKTIQKYLDREQKVVELSDLIAIMQSEIELKQSDMINEINFYKNKISDIGQNKQPMLDKSINTSSLTQNELIMQVPSNIHGQEKCNDLDLTILENVMNNLQVKCVYDINNIHNSFCSAIANISQDHESQNNLQVKCVNDINNIHNSFCSVIANISQDHESQSPQWITLSNKLH